MIADDMSEILRLRALLEEARDIISERDLEIIKMASLVAEARIELGQADNAADAQTIEINDLLYEIHKGPP